MTQYIARRLLLNLVVILIVMTFIFITLRILPGDFAAQQVSDQFFAGRGGDPEEALRLAVQHNKRNWRYVRAILDRWDREGRDRGLVGRAARGDGRRFVSGRYAGFIDS